MMMGSHRVAIQGGVVGKEAARVDSTRDPRSGYSHDTQ